MKDCDVIVVGASNSGTMAAAAAAEKGAKVLVIDKMHSAKFLFRNTIASVGSKAQKKAGLKIDKMKLVNFLAAFAQYHVQQDLLWTWVNHSAETVDWLDDNVLKPHGDYMQATTDAKYESLVNTAFPTGNEVTKHDGSYWEIGWGQWAIEKAQSLGAEYRWDTALQHLLIKQGKVIGVQVMDTKNQTVENILANKGVILCTGGYGANKALMEKWDPAGLKTIMYSDSPRDDGSGILAGMEAGAARDEEPASIIFNRGAVPVGTNAETFYDIGFHDIMAAGYLWLGSYPFLKVNLQGKRFFNESSPYQFDMNAEAMQPGHIEATIWTGETMKEENLKKMHTLGCSRLNFPGIFTAEQARQEVANNVKGGLVKKADTLKDLAKQLHLPVEQFKKTVARYNEMCKQGKDTDYGKEAYRLFPVNKAPYYGCWLGGRLLATFDGLRINTKMQVIKENGDPIPHLFAAGNCSGGFFWGSYPDRVPGLAASHADTFGRLAGQNAATLD